MPDPTDNKRFNIACVANIKKASCGIPLWSLFPCQRASFPWNQSPGAGRNNQKDGAPSSWLSRRVKHRGASDLLIQVAPCEVWRRLAAAHLVPGFDQETPTPSGPTGSTAGLCSKAEKHHFHLMRAPWVFSGNGDRVGGWGRLVPFQQVWWIRNSESLNIWDAVLPPDLWWGIEAGADNQSRRQQSLLQSRWYWFPSWKM